MTVGSNLEGQLEMAVRRIEPDGFSEDRRTTVQDGDEDEGQVF
ncbi:MAG TPA: hypothetical protein VHS06_07705 [Chloroflexota bacterium]|nr:hypothetical protein [Chloroflexota bacterium]